MVYVSSTHYEDAYRRIADTAATTAGASVLLFVSMDADALCALRILTSLFKRDSIAHKIVPVSNYAEITSMNQTLAQNQQIKSIVFLNCGAQTDVQDFVTLRDDLVVMVIDSHRPFNLYNVFWHEQVQCLDDGDVEKNMGELREAFEDIEFGDSSSGEDSDESEDEGSDQDNESRIGHKRGSSEMLGDLAKNDRQRRKRKTDLDPESFMRMQQQKAERRDARAAHQQMIQAYYAQGSYYGQSCAISTLMLAEQLGHPPSLDTVWWAVVGATSQHVLQHIDSDGYAEVVRRMRDLVRRVCPTASTTRLNIDGNARSSNTSESALGSSATVTSSSQALLDSQLGLPGQPDDPPQRENIDPFNPYLEMIPEDEDEGYLRARAGAASNGEAGLLTSSKNIEQSVAISESTELKFLLLRHWSLTNAMQYSPYVATRLGTWSSKGRSRLDLLVAKLGLSRAEAQAPFLHLDPELKLQLYRKMHAIGADYNMADSLYAGFVRDYGWRKSRVSASDMVLAILALLQKDAWAGEYESIHISTSGFFAAYDSLSQFDILRAGLHGAQHLQRLVVGQGISMLERQAVKTLRVFRLAILGELESSSHVFGSPFALRQLALFLMQTLRERSKSAHARLPFIIAGPIAQETSEVDKLMVLGITPMDYPLVRPHMDAPFNRSTYAGESRNHFGIVFEQVASEVGAEAKQGFFDSSVMEIRRSDMSAFVDKLRRHL
ncbi:DNA replication initiation factor cdc45 [Coemansia sp. RSA 353]|nr:DNA replication initiation factor cdc45 [Coemansia sp. RSA 521]KAJ2289177.1 DNA replication initiation factor cdc45 [Coemansia sp. RSA 355]KAJ2298006.1 DNA replication initiation factor cdc45 [Coemansia sp. RSA 353]